MEGGGDVEKGRAEGRAWVGVRVWGAVMAGTNYRGNPSESAGFRAG